MLTISPAAAAAIDQALGDTAIPDHAGLRLAAGGATDGGVSIEMAFVVEPLPEDEVLDVGARADVILEPHAAELLTDQVLDAAVEPDGAITFSLHPQPDDAGPS
jgi:Fe-S cluster assembly iron-binding protein IscA